VIIKKKGKPYKKNYEFISPKTDGLEALSPKKIAKNRIKDWSKRLRNSGKIALF